MNFVILRWLNQRRGVALAAASVGSVAFLLLGIPLPILLGPMAGCLVAALCRQPMQDMGVFSIFMRTFLGVAIGCSITPEVLHDFPRYLQSIFFIPIFVLIIGLVGYPLFRRVFHYDKATAYYASMPGGLSDMLVFGQEAGGNPRALSLIHATRVMGIIWVVPTLMAMIWQIDLHKPPGVPIYSVPCFEILLMPICGLLGWKIAERFQIFGASILGPMILTAIVSLSGLIHTRPPAEIMWCTQFFIGLSVGVHYTGITLTEVRKDIFAGVVYSLVLATISGCFIMMIIKLGIASELNALLAFLAGGQAEMMMIAVITGADLTYVLTHHLTRLILVVLGAPIVHRFLQ